jgi:hypothetical protein
MSNNQLYNKLSKLTMNQYDTIENARNRILVPNNPDDRDHENTDDIIYFNFEVNNNATEEKAVELKFDINRLDPILKNPSAYEYGIERFSSPATIPIFIDDFQQFPLIVEIYDPNVEGGFSSTDIVEVLQNNLLIQNGFREPYKNYIKNGVYDYQTLVNAINLAFKNCVDIFNVNHPEGLEFPIDNDGNFSTPFIRYFQSTGNFSLYAPEEPKEDPEVRRVYFNQGKYFPYEYGGQPEKPYLPLQIRFSRTLAKLFSGLQQFNFNDDDETSFEGANEPVLMVIQDLFITTATGNIDRSNLIEYQGVDYRYSTTQYDIRKEMNQFDKILFLTDAVPVKDELLGEIKAVQERQLFDYVISNRLQNREQINFFPQYIKWSNLQAQQELRQFTMNVYLQYRFIENKTDNNGNTYKQPVLYPLTLQPNERFSAKIVFRKRKLLNVRNIQ